MLEEMCHHSTRIQKNSKGLPASYIKSAQRVLMSRMGICNLEDEPLVDCLEKYAKLFRELLPPHRVEALTKLFSLDVPFPETSLSIEF